MAEQSKDLEKLDDGVQILDVISRKLVVMTFNFHGHELQVIKYKGGFWFIGNEACEALEYKNSRQAIAGLSPHQRGTLGIPDALGRIQQSNIISEGGLYKLAFRSHKKEAEEFTDLVADVILPTIRKTGRYDVHRSGDRRPYAPSAERLLLPPAQQDTYLYSILRRLEIATDRQLAQYLKWWPVTSIRQRTKELAALGSLVAHPNNRTVRYTLP